MVAKETKTTIEGANDSFFEDVRVEEKVEEDNDNFFDDIRVDKTNAVVEGVNVLKADVRVEELKSGLEFVAKK